jgi:hypothetical protein
MDAVEFFSKLRHLGEQLTNPAIGAASLVPGAAGLVLHGGEWVVTSTVDGLVAQARDSWDCASTIITTGEMRGVGRQCLKAVALGALTLAGLPELDAGVLTLSSLGRAESGNVLRRLAYDETGTLWIGRDAAESAAWTLPKAGGARIGGRWFTEHALERMAPRTPEVLADLERRALARAEAASLKPGTPEFGKWWRSYGPDPRGIPPSVVEAEIANPGSTGVRVITNPNGDVVTVIPGGG